MLQKSHAMKKQKNIAANLDFVILMEVFHVDVQPGEYRFELKTPLQ